MSYIPVNNYASFSVNVKPYSFFSSLVKPIREPIVPVIKNQNGDELKAFWQPEALHNNKLIHNLSITSNAEYRKYMTSKADIIRDYNMRNISK